MNIESIDELVASDYKNHTLLPPGVPEGREGLKVFANTLRSAFPDLTHRADAQVGEGDLATIYITRTGTMNSWACPRPESKRPGVRPTSPGSWAAVDQFGMAQQLGLIPAGQAAAAAR